jgi:4-hydroxy-3-methylbut-2-enyl diphosphate reductase
MKRQVTIEKSTELGFCCGVRRAISLLEKSARSNHEIETLGPVVHNRQVVEELEDKGIRQVASLKDVRGRHVAITAHGTDPETINEIQSRGLEVVDTTCSIVKSAQKAAAKYAAEGYGIIIFGDPEHTEVRGITGWAGEKSLATTNPADIKRWKEMPKRLAVISQSTQSHSGFLKFIGKALEATLPRLREVHIVNTICEVTQQRQAAARELAGRCDLIIVVGGRNSANTRRLAETCGESARTYAVETASEIRREWLKGKKHIGIVAGTSTPDDVVNDVFKKLESLTAA